MDSTVTPSSTETFNALNNAIEVNKQNIKTFKEMIVEQLKFIIEHLENCDPTNASDALDLTLPQLKTVISKINDNRGMLTTDVESIMAPLKAIKLRKAPDSATPLAIGPTRNSLSKPSIPPPSASTLPRPPLGPITNPGGTGQKSDLPIRTMVRGGKRTRRFRKK